MTDRKNNGPKTELASLSPECMNQLCDMVIAKLKGKYAAGLDSQASCRGFGSHHPLQDCIDLLPDFFHKSDFTSPLNFRHLRIVRLQGFSIGCL